MNILKRVISMLLCVTMVAGVIYVSKTEVLSEKADKSSKDKDSLVVWYTDENLTDFINTACVSYNEMYGVRVVAKLQSGDEYLEQINQASIKNDGTPDLYVISNDMLERAYLGGLATNITADDAVFDVDFPEAAKHAVTYKGHIVAYPFYYETSAFLYNRTYLYDMASNQLMADESAEPENEGEEAEAVVAEDEVGLSTEEKVEKRLQASIPQTFEQLLEFANTCDAPAEVETIFKWDVKDIFYNYFFVGNYVNIGGESGDDSSQIDIYNMNAITALTVYQDLNQFFSFEYEDITYDSVIQDFIDGKIIFTTATSDVISRLEAARENGEFNFEYGVTAIPNLNDNLTTKGMSVTSTVAVNGFSDKKDLANSFAKYLTVNKAQDLYSMTGKLSSCNTITYDNEAMNAYFEAYTDSVPIPKMMATSNYWLLAEIAFSNIWAGKNVNEEVKNLSEQLKGQVAGVDISEDYLDVPTDSDDEIEYFDEDAEREAAQDDGTGEESSEE